MNTRLTILSTLLLFLLPTQAQGQFPPCYHYRIAKANFLVTHKNDCKTAQTYLRKAFEVAEGEVLSKDLLIAAKVYDCLGQKDSVIHCFREAIRKSGYDWEMILDWKEQNLYGKYDTVFEELKLEYPILKRRHQAAMDLDWYSTLIALGQIDQRFRNGDMRREMEKCSTDEEVKYPPMGISDSISMKILMEKIEADGFPPLQNMDFEATRAIFLMLMHGGTYYDWAWVFFDESLLKEIEKGNFDPNLYAKIRDRYLQSKAGKGQFFGAYNSVCSGRVICPIDDIEEVDRRRLLIGLLPLNESWEVMTGFKLPEDYVPSTDAEIEDWLGECR